MASKEIGRNDVTVSRATKLMGRGMRLFRAVSSFSSRILVWFALMLSMFVLVIANDILSVRWTDMVWWEHFYSLSVPFLTGGIVSFLFFFLVVYVPDRRKRRLIKEYLRQFYRTLKRDILYEVTFACKKGGRRDLGASSDTVKKLLTVEGYRKAFRGGKNADEGIYAFRNGLCVDGSEYREIVWHLQVLAKQIDYVLRKYPFADPKIFDFFKRLEVSLLSWRDSEPGYDESKRLSGFLGEIFGGFSIIDGYRGYDIVEKMIEEI